MHPQILDILKKKGIEKFTPVQGEAFEPVLAGRDVIGRSRTGTGKTLAFGLPTMTRLVPVTVEKGTRDEASGRMRRGRKPSMLILCPTRELARQVQDELDKPARILGFETAVFHGGVSCKCHVHRAEAVLRRFSNLSYSFVGVFPFFR